MVIVLRLYTTFTEDVPSASIVAEETLCRWKPVKSELKSSSVTFPR